MHKKNHVARGVIRPILMLRRLIVVGYSYADDHINRLIFEALSSNASLQTLVLEPFGVHEGTDPDSHPLDDSDPIACQLAHTTDARLSVPNGGLALFESFSNRVMPDPDDMARGEVEEILEESLAAALLSDDES